MRAAAERLAHIRFRFNCQTANAPFLSFPRKRESIITAPSRAFGLWVPARACCSGRRSRTRVRGRHVGIANAPPPVFFAKGAGYAFISCPSQRRGTARQSAQPLVSARILRCVAPFGAPSRRSFPAPGRAFRRGIARLVRQPAPGRGLSPGRSPGAARLRDLLVTPAGAGLIHTTRSNRFASLRGTKRFGL